MKSLTADVERALGSAVEEARALAVGFGLTGYQARLADGRKIAIKAAVDDASGASDASTASDASGEGGLALEAYMLRELAAHSDLPLPDVLHASRRLLIMSWIDNDDGPIGRAAQHHAGELLAALHGQRFCCFGYSRDTVIGPLHQPNPRHDKWLPFFRDWRLVYMARRAHDAGQLDAALLTRIEKLGDRLDRYLCEPDHPALLHGDLWSGNILVKGACIAGFIDPAIYYGHREIELAFTTMFGTFGRPFFDAYEALLPLQPGFHDMRRDIYNLYPALVHVRLFGASYLAQVKAMLDRLGL